MLDGLVRYGRNLMYGFYYLSYLGLFRERTKSPNSIFCGGVGMVGLDLLIVFFHWNVVYSMATSTQESSETGIGANDDLLLSRCCGLLLLQVNASQDDEKPKHADVAGNPGRGRRERGRCI
ncbi:hypothetical protein GE21DRAFT_1060959 [Neurospora crassa]|nr:hypothetical protein GE21DRAFT_1060959 [Neurospora crassa]